MSPWLLAQAAYAATAWSIGGRAVWRSFEFGGHTGRELADTVRDLRGAGRPGDLARLGEILAPSPVAMLLETDADGVDATELVSTAQAAATHAAPPIRVLRSLATLGTMLGLLAAVSSLRGGLEAPVAGGMELAASRAFDSAIVGFLTAMPCWAAAGLCARRIRETYGELELVVLAMRSPLPTGVGTDLRATDGDRAVDEGEHSQ